jgi:5-methylcytosine-specific restriction endonuclease McrA
MERLILCYRCKTEVIGIEQTKKTTVPKVGRSNCPSCKLIFKTERIKRLNELSISENLRNHNSKRMKKSNPMKDTKISSKVSKKLKEKYLSGELISPWSKPEIRKKCTENYHIADEAKKENSERMKQSNPMFNSNSVLSMKNTTKERRKSGKIKDKRGKEHWLWKGNRDFNNTVRVQLHAAWIVPVMERDEFKCAICKSTKNLQVHHLKPLREFLLEIKNKYNISQYCELSGDEKITYALEIVKMHKLEHGITVCKSCHGEIDNYYKAGKDKK